MYRSQFLYEATLAHRTVWSRRQIMQQHRACLGNAQHQGDDCVVPDTELSASQSPGMSWSAFVGRLQVGEGFLLGNPDQVSFNPIQAEAAETGVIRCDAPHILCADTRQCMTVIANPQ